MTRCDGVPGEVLKRFQNTLKTAITGGGRLARGRDGKGEADEEGGVHAGQVDRDADADGTDDEGGDARDADFLAGTVFFAVMDHVGVKVVREAGAGAHGETGDDGEDGGKGDGADESEEDSPPSC
jgi:hypothetical protein